MEEKLDWKMEQVRRDLVQKTKRKVFCFVLEETSKCFLWGVIAWYACFEFLETFPW